MHTRSRTTSALGKNTRNTKNWPSTGTTTKKIYPGDDNMLALRWRSEWSNQRGKGYSRQELYSDDSSATNENEESENEESENEESENEESENEESENDEGDEHKDRRNCLLIPSGIPSVSGESKDNDLDGVFLIFSKIIFRLFKGQTLEPVLIELQKILSTYQKQNGKLA